jgi:putative flippase GtrA
MRARRNLNYGARYVVFAAVATLANLAMQEATVRAFPPAPLLVSMAVGTIAGFAVKYVLDKNWIFYDPVEGKYHEARKISLYGLFSVFTTVIFWSFESAFWLLWGTAAAKYSGAVIGLAVGYAAKYELDRRYTFRKAGVQWN